MFFEKSTMERVKSYEFFEKILRKGLILGLVAISISLASSTIFDGAYGDNSFKEKILKHYNLKFSLSEEVSIFYEAYGEDHSDTITDELKELVSTLCNQRNSSNSISPEYSLQGPTLNNLGCKKINFTDEYYFDDLGKFFVVEYSAELKFPTIDKSSNPIYDSQKIDSWIMYGQFKNGGLLFQPTRLGFDAEYNPTGDTGGYWKNFEKIELIEPKKSIKSVQNLLTDEILIKRKIPVNIFIFGNQLSDEDIAKIKFKLPKNNRPIIGQTGEYIGIEYQYNYNFRNVDSNLSEELKNKIIENSKKSNLLTTMCDLSCEYLLVDEKNIKNSEYRLVDAHIIENFLYDNLIKNEYEKMPNLIFFNYDLNELNFLRNYSLQTNDYSYQEKFNAIGLMGYGGSKELFYVDLYSLPWKNMDSDGNFYLDENFQTALFCDNCENNIIEKYTSDFLSHVVNPFFVYDPGMYSEINVDLLIYQIKRSNIGISQSTLEKFINVEVIEKELSTLYPGAKWNINVILTDKEKRDLDRWMIDELENMDSYTYADTGKTFLGAKYVSPDYIAPIMKYWSGSQHNNHFDNTSKNIPILIYLHDNPFDLYIGDYGTQGLAFPDIYSDEGCCVFIALNSKYFWSSKYGATDIVLHEMGHILGLNHPFQKADKDGIVENNFWNFNLSPMIYADPTHPNSCAGVFNNILVKREIKSGYTYSEEIVKEEIEREPLYGKLCGISGTSFTQFEKNRMMDAIVSQQLQEANNNIQLHKAQNNEPNSKTILKIQSLIKKTSNEFLMENPNYDKALSMSEDALEQSKTLLYYTDSITGLVPNGNIILDEYYNEGSFMYAIFINSNNLSSDNGVKINFKGKYDDKFTGGEYVVAIKSLEDFSEKTFSVPIMNGNFDFSYKFDSNALEGDYLLCIGQKCEYKVYFHLFNESKTVTQKINKVPDWIKNNAKWWADGQVDDSTFSQGIGFLIKNKVISISSVQPQASSVSEEKIPDWIKNNAKWWADGMISEDDFLKGITYMVEKGIIRAQ